jgi:hypothetical protein
MNICIVYLASPRDTEYSFGKKLTALQKPILSKISRVLKNIH